MERRGELARCRMRVTGRVQGVGFRYFTLSAARRCRVVGWVHNESDGSVLCEAQGESDDLQRFEVELHRGPRFSRVDAVEVEVIAVSDAEELTFEVR